MKYALCIKSRFCLEIIERILRIIRHRGFELHAINIEKKNNNNNIINIYIDVFSNTRSIYILLTQLNKLIDVISIKLSNY
ncbi:MAG: acetolactate synthase 2 small subunit [Enterobacterales bacterium]